MDYGTPASRSYAMTIQYEIDENIFLEINTNWLCPSVNEFLIKARHLDTDQAGNSVEYFQLNDGRVFIRPINSGPRSVEKPKSSKNRPWKNIRPAMTDRSITQPR